MILSRNNKKTMLCCYKTLHRAPGLGEERNCCLGQKSEDSFSYK